MSDATRSLLAAAMRRHGLGGGALAVVSRHGEPDFECAGLADAKPARPVDPDTVFRIASISKTMTAIGIMQLRDRGLFDLDDPVNKYLTTITVEPPSGGPVTFRHLLTHTSGIGELARVTDLVRREAWGQGKPRTGPADLAKIYGGTLHTDVAVGTKWAYANHAFAVLGQLVEDISGEPFAEHMRTHLFDPLGMQHTEYQRTDRTAGRLATGHHWLFSRFRAVNDYDLSLYGPGSVLSAATDMARYAAWLAGRPSDPEPLARVTLAEMMSPQFAVHPRMPGMGLAFWVDHLGSHRVAGHDGNVPGFASGLLVAPDEGVGVVALTNTSSAMGAHLLARAALREILGLPDEVAELTSSTVVDAPNNYQELVGHYAPAPGFLTNARSWQMLGGEVEVLVRDRRLVIRSLSPLEVLRKGVELHPIDPDELLYAATAEGLVVPVAFGRTERGDVDRVILGPPSNSVLHRRSRMRSARVRWRVARAAGVGLVATRILLRRRTGGDGEK